MKLEELSEPYFDESCVRRLVLPKKIKTLILASVKDFVDQDATSRQLRGAEASAEYQFDLTHRRGTNLKILLHGDVGGGKSLAVGQAHHSFSYLISTNVYQVPVQRR